MSRTTGLAHSLASKIGRAILGMSAHLVALTVGLACSGVFLVGLAAIYDALGLLDRSGRSGVGTGLLSLGGGATFLIVYKIVLKAIRLRTRSMLEPGPDEEVVLLGSDE